MTIFSFLDPENGQKDPRLGPKLPKIGPKIALSATGALSKNRAYRHVKSLVNLKIALTTFLAPDVASIAIFTFFDVFRPYIAQKS